jgi:protocatechuate 3,4-dioxygenase, beta subunit
MICMTDNHILDRRRLLMTAAVAGATTTWPKVGVSATVRSPLALTPSQMEGPFYPVALPADTDADLLRNGTRDYRPSQVAWVEGVVKDPDGAPLSGAVVEIWQCDDHGHYHHPGDGNRADPAFQGFGRVTVGSDGRYRFKTLKPAPYTGRTPHIHFKVKLGRHDLLTTQLYVAGHPSNAHDGLWRRLSAADRAALTMPFEPDRTTAGGVKAHFPIVVMA